jgi:uncharacterized protein YjcR
MKDLYNIADVAEVFVVSQETVRRWYRDGKINGQKKSNKNGIMFNKFDILDFMRGNPKYGAEVYYASLFWYPDSPTVQYQLNVTMPQIKMMKYLNEHPEHMSTIKKAIKKANKKLVELRKTEG